MPYIRRLNWKKKSNNPIPFIPFPFTVQLKSELGFNLLAAINSSRLKMYPGDGSLEYQELWFEMEMAKSQYRTSQTMNF